MTLRNALRGVALFEGVADSDMCTLARTLGRRTFGAGVFIYHKDSPGRVLYIIESGRVRLFALSDMGQEISRDVLGPGESFGELAVLDGRPRASGAVALETTVTLTWHRDDLLPSLQTCPRLAVNLMEVLAGKLRYAGRHIEDLAFLNVYGRVAARLLDLAARCGVDEDGMEIDLGLTQSELATWVAASRERVNRALRVLRKKRLITVEGQRITILDRRRLEREIVY